MVMKKKMKRTKKEKKGWIEVVEAFVAILLIAGVALAVVLQHQGTNRIKVISQSIFNAETAMLREVEQNDTLRQEIVEISVSLLPMEGTNFSSALPQTTALIQRETPGSLECQGKICQLGDLCFFSGSQDVTVYAVSSIISADMQTYNPRTLKIFCWEK